MKKQPEVTEMTRQKFVDSFWSLVSEKPVSKISVSELTRRAGYNRSTFYEYFLDTDDLLTYVESKLLEEIKQTICQVTNEGKTPNELFKTVFATMNEKIYLLIGKNGDSGFIDNLKKEVRPLVENFLSSPENVEHFDYLICYADSAMFGLLQHWHETGKDINTDEVCALMQKLVIHGLASCFNNDE